MVNGVAVDQLATLQTIDLQLGVLIIVHSVTIVVFGVKLDEGPMFFEVAFVGE